MKGLITFEIPLNNLHGLWQNKEMQGSDVKNILEYLKFLYRTKKKLSIDQGTVIRKQELYKRKQLVQGRKYIKDNTKTGCTTKIFVLRHFEYYI